MKNRAVHGDGELNQEVRTDSADADTILGMFSEPRLDNVACETAALSNNAQFLALIERSRTRHAIEGGVSTEEMRQRLGI